MSEINLENLPVELIYRIFDHLDGKSILCSARSVSKRFYNVANSYNRYRIDFRGLRMVDFEILCKKINPSNVQKLILSNDERTIGLMKMFLTKFRLDEFVHLRQLILSHIEDPQLEISLEQLGEHSIRDLSIVKFALYDNKDHKYHLLSNVIRRPLLEKLDLQFRLTDMKNFPWPMECSLKYLRLGNIITLNQYYTILDQSPFLEIFILRDCSNKQFISLPIKSFKQLNSLTFEHTRMTLDEFQHVLSYTPSIEFLKLIGTKYLSDGFALETIIESCLPLLKTFQFYFDSWENPSDEDFQSVICSYQSPFWIEEKRWFINCELYFFNGTTEMRLYSLPLCYHKFDFDSTLGECSFTTLDQADPSNDSVQHLSLDLNRPIPILRHYRNIPNDVIFPNVTQLQLFLSEYWSDDYFDFLSRLINLANLRILTITANGNSRLNRNLVENVRLLLEKTENADTLSFTGGQSPQSSRITLEEIFQIVPKHIKHLRVMVRDFDEVGMIIDTLEHLSSIIFQIVRVMARGFSDNRLSITQRRKYSICEKMDPYLNVWLGQANTNHNHHNE